MTNHPNDNEEVIELSFEEVLEWSQRFVQDTERKLGTKFDEEELKQVRDFIQDLEDSGEEYDLDTIKCNIFLFKLLSNCSKNVDLLKKLDRKMFVFDKKFQLFQTDYGPLKEDRYRQITVLTA